jgi:hypothetical protein
MGRTSFLQTARRGGFSELSVTEFAPPQPNFGVRRKIFEKTGAGHRQKVLANAENCATINKEN